MLIAIVLRLFVCLTCVSLVARAGQSDARKPRVIEGWGSVVDPDGDCTVKGEQGKLTMTVPNKLHNLNPAIASNAPRVLQEVAGDFTAFVKVTGEFKPGD